MLHHKKCIIGSKDLSKKTGVFFLKKVILFFLKKVNKKCIIGSKDLSKKTGVFFLKKVILFFLKKVRSIQRSGTEAIRIPKSSPQNQNGKYLILQKENISWST